MQIYPFPPRHRLQLAETFGSDPGAGAFVLVHHRLLDAAVLAQKIRVYPLYTKKDALKYFKGQVGKKRSESFGGQLYPKVKSKQKKVDE